MSFHKTPKYQIPALIEALKLHGLEHDTPSHGADFFRMGWLDGQADKDAEIAVLTKQADDLRFNVHDLKLSDAGARLVCSRQQAEIAALKAVTMAPIPETLAKSLFDGLASNPKAEQFSAFNWFTAGVASAEEWQKTYLDAAMAQAVQPQQKENHE